MQEKSDRKKLYIRILWAIFVIPVFSLILIFILISKGAIGYIPDFISLENPQNDLASLIITEDDQLLGKYYKQNRTDVNFEDLSPNLINALIATEDIRFKRHSGIDAKGLARVLFRTILGGQNTGGGSTISQQLAKNLFRIRENKPTSWIGIKFETITYKLSEWVTAVLLEKRYTKKEILVMYLNTVDFGHEVFGIQSASQVFFDTTPDSLKIEEAAILVGLLQAPTRYSPIKNPENCIKRRNTVLSQMYKYGFLDEAIKDSVRNLPLVADYYSQSHTSGLGNHFREYLRKTLTKTKPVKEEYFLYSKFQEDSAEWETNPLFGWANKHTKPDGSNYNIYTDGLKIYTTINYKMQEYAEAAVKKHLGDTLQEQFFKDRALMKHPPFSNDLDLKTINMIMKQAVHRCERYKAMKSRKINEDSIRKVFDTPVPMKVFTWEGEVDTVMSPLDSLKYYKHILRAGMLVMEPGTGHVKVYVGGHNYKYFKYDQVTQGKRQVGSTIKPFLYVMAMQEGYTPCHIISNIEITFPDRDSTWTPTNSDYNDMLGKEVTLEWGLAHSVNTVSAWLLKQFNPQAVVDVMKKMGVRSEMDPVYSIIYGTSDIYLEEMVGAYNTFSNKGIYIEPMYVSKIEDKHGNVISTFYPQQVEAFSEKTAYLMVKLLQNVVNEGTAGRLRWYFGFKSELGGKTGTTQNQSDGWFMAIAPKITAGVWVGAEDRSIRFKSLSQGSGSAMALPIYGHFLKSVYADTTLGITPEDVWEEPQNFDINLDCPEVVRGIGVIRNEQTGPQFN